MPPTPSTLDYARPITRSPDQLTLPVLGILLALLSIIANSFLLLNSGPRAYLGFYRHSLDRGYLQPPESHLEVTTFTYGDVVCAVYVSDIVVSLLLALLLITAGVFALRSSPKALFMYGLYIRWKCVFAFVGACAGVAYSIQIIRFTRHISVGALPLEVDFLLTLGASLLTPLIVHRILRRERPYLERHVP